MDLDLTDPKYREFMPIYYYHIQVVVGMTYVNHTISAQLMYEQRSRSDGVHMAALLIEQLVYQLHKEGIAIESPGKKSWVLLTGEKGYQGVIGKGFRDVRSEDFTPYTKNNAILKGALIPADSVPKKCDRPGCGKWATNDYGVVEVRSPITNLPTALGHHLWGKTWYPGDTIYCCPPHAHELVADVQGQYLRFRV